MRTGSDNEVTRLLRRWRGGDEGAHERLTTLLYDELRRLARAQMQRERRGHTLSPTALVHEAHLRLVGAQVEWQSRTHFLSVAAGVMRRVLVDHARRRLAEKRGGDAVFVTLSPDEPSSPSGSLELLALHGALERLSSLDARQARVVELHYFGGLTYEEIAEVTSVSRATVERCMTHGRAWLQVTLSADA